CDQEGISLRSRSLTCVGSCTVTRGAARAQKVTSSRITAPIQPAGKRMTKLAMPSPSPLVRARAPVRKTTRGSSCTPLCCAISSSSVSRVTWARKPLAQGVHRLLHVTYPRIKPGIADVNEEVNDYKDAAIQ